MSKLFPILIVSFLIFGCSGAELTPKGRKILKAHSLTDLKDCELVKNMEVELTTETSMMQGVLPNLKQVENELAIQARNQAVIHGGTHVISTNEFNFGKQEWDAYKCNN